MADNNNYNNTSIFQPPFPLSTHLEVRWLYVTMPGCLSEISPEVSLGAVVRVYMEKGVFAVILGRLTIASNSFFYIQFFIFQPESRRKKKNKRYFL